MPDDLETLTTGRPRAMRTERQVPPAPESLQHQPNAPYPQYYGQPWAYLQPNEEVIDLVKIFKAVSRYLPGIMAGALLGGLLGLIFATLSPKTYKSAVLVEFIASPMAKILNPLEEIRQQQQQQQQGTLEAKEQYKVLAKSAGVINLAKQKLENQGLPYGQISFAITDIPKTNILAFEAHSQDQTLVSPAASTWQEATLEFLAKLNSENSLTGYSALSKQYQDNKKIINDLQAKVELIKPTLTLQEAELNIKNGKLLEYMAQLERIKTDLADAEIALPVLKEEIQKYQEDSRANKQNSTGKTLVMLANAPNSTGENESNVRLGAFNSLHDELQRQISSYDVASQTLKPKKEHLETLSQQNLRDISRLQQSIATQRIELAALQRDLQIAQKEFETIYSRITDSKLASSLSPTALRPLSPASPPSQIKNIKILLAKGIVLGMLAGLVASLLFYHRKQLIPAI
ncbi:MAG: hypothetical protein HYT79_00745 [Elusimicrobia bacterium]|nr:hypothetical protein [Elusimicrobiota bacterium]